MLKDSNITIRMTNVHKQQIKQHANNMGLSVGSYLLMLAIRDMKAGK